jgi:hypothetical protein
MNKFTADYHQGTFPGFAMTKPYQQVVDAFWFSKDIPFIETDFDIDATETHRWLVDHDHLFEQRYTQTNRLNFAKQHGYDWFTDVHSHDWHTLDVLGLDYAHGQLITNGQAQEQIYQNNTHPDAVPDLKIQLDKVGLPVEKIYIQRLAPGGWVQPHMDKHQPGAPVMNHVWLPLNSSALSLKIYPSGYVHHRPGRIYLVNNTYYAHSAINTDSEPRYVAIMKIDYQQLPEESWNRIQQSLQQQWFETS